jgi:hypothetical protein
METHTEKHRLWDGIEDKVLEVSEDKIGDLFGSRTHKLTWVCN